MTEINQITSIEKRIFNNLDVKDGTQDEKIEASVWNAFVAEIGTGNKIKYSINKDNAMKSISVYIERIAKKANSVKEFLDNISSWSDTDKLDDRILANMSASVKAKKAEQGKDPLSPPRDLNPPAEKDNGLKPGQLFSIGKSGTMEYFGVNIEQKYDEYKNQSVVEIPKGSGYCFDFNDQGYIIKMYNIHNDSTHTINRNGNNKIQSCESTFVRKINDDIDFYVADTTVKYDANGQVIDSL